MLCNHELEFQRIRHCRGHRVERLVEITLSLMKTLNDTNYKGGIGSLRVYIVVWYTVEPPIKDSPYSRMQYIKPPY